MVDGKRVRADKRLLGRTEGFEVGGRRIEAAIVQDRSFHNGTLHEIALDFYAQADDGTVYYLGEDVDYYDKRGHVTGHHGSFRYGEDTGCPRRRDACRPASGRSVCDRGHPGPGQGPQQGALP